MTDITDRPAPHTKVALQTEHKRTLTELERYKILVENVQDYAIFFMDPEGYIQTWNKGAEKNKGYTHKEIIGKHFSIFYSDQDNADKKPERELEIAKKVGRVEDEDWRYRKDGSKFWANVVITALYDEDQNLQGFAKVTRNLTERKVNEDSLRSANSLLQEQQKELQRLNESKDEFISLASHQLRTPATAIKQLLGLILEGFEGDVPQNIRRLLEKTYESNERQIGIVNGLLKVAQIDSGKVILRKRSYDVNDVVHSLVKQYSGIIEEKSQTISVEIHDEPLFGYIDEQYYRMALENLLDNASKYTENGGTITITSKAVDDTVVVGITDTGVGISPENIHSLFMKFNRIPNDLSHKVAGSGLGLYWVDKVIDLHQGKITVDSKLHEGTTFSVCVPKGM
ncbi:MAG: hybrid sensor histidine kinase/response regulator [Candidatus Saccharibacteria bacterium]|nr:hybrid sensor histidine kinase/response regulator [Candidatus Saccharibacteria bacterium]